MKRLFTLFLLLFAIVTAKANPVDQNTAREVGAKFLHASALLKSDNPAQLQLATIYRTANNDAAFYVFNASNSYVMVSADDCATPILGYSESQIFTGDDLPIQLEEYLQHFVEQIQYGIENHLVADEATARQWELVRTTGQLNEARNATAVAPLLTDTWNQNCYYNNLCPTDSNGPCGHVYAGCAATSFSQIMHYWGYPAQGTGSHTYTPSGYPQQTANFGATTYQWSDMPDNLYSGSTSAQINAVATLMWHCGVAIEMSYGPGGSGASPSMIPTAFVNYFNYSNDLYMAFKNNYTNAQWLNMVKNDLDNGRPIHYSGYSSTGDEGHGFVCDGYNASDMLHFNWGWSGNHNNYYALDALTPPNGYNFSYNNIAIFNIHPDNPAYEITISANPSDAGTVAFINKGDRPGTTYNFDDGTMQGWTTLDADGDGYTWNNAATAMGTGYGHNGSSNMVYSQSYDNSYGVLFPDNYLISPNKDQYPSISFWACAQDAGYAAEHFGVAVSTTTATASAFTMLQEWTMTAKNSGVMAPGRDGQTRTQGTWREYTVDLSAYAGQEIWVAIRHFNCSDMYFLNVDDITFMPEGTAIYYQGEPCTVSATANTGYTFFGWTENGNVVSTAANYTFTVNSNRNLVANFTTGQTQQYTISVSANPANGGNVSGGGIYNQGTSCTVTATPNSGYIFSNWTQNGSVTSTSASYTFVVNTDRDLVANFTPGPTQYTINAYANPENGGTVSGGGAFTAGQTCTLTAVPNPNFTFSNWTAADGSTVSTNPTYSFTVTGNASYVANFNTMNAGYGELGYTTYDWQSNGGARTWTHVWPDGKVNFAFTQATNSTYTDRGTGIGTYDAINDVWTASSSRVENEKTGFGSIAQYGTNGIVVAAHTATQCGIYIIPDKDNYTPGTIMRAGTLDPTKDPCWPSVMTSGPNRDIIHVVATCSDDNKTYYFRTQDGGQTWDKQNEILPFMDESYGYTWESNRCYWMETTEDNCLALVVNNPWSDGMVIYSYDNGESWERKVFFKHPNHNATYDNMLLYPRWTSCQWDSQHHLHVLYEFNAISGEPGSGTYYPGIGGVAYWNETMPYNINGTTQSAIPGNLTPGQPFVMDTAYLYHDIYASWWLFSDASHEMWPEYIGYLAPLSDDGTPEDPYNNTGLNIEDRSMHGNYNSGVCAFPVLCMVPGTDEMVAVWSAMDENHQDIHSNYYYKLFASYSNDGGTTWSPMIHLTNMSQFNNTEFTYNQAVVVGRKLIIASQIDGETGTYLQTDESDYTDNHYQGFVFDIDELFNPAPVQQYVITTSVDPANTGSVTGAGTYNAGTVCTLTAQPNTGYQFSHWTKNDVTVSTNPVFSFLVTEDAAYVAHFVEQSATYTITATANPLSGGTVSGSGTYDPGATCTLTATANTGYNFVNWTKNGTVVSLNNTFSFNVTEDAVYVANFEEQIVNYTITATANPAEGGIVSGGGTYTEGTVCTLTALPNTGYNFVNWTKNGNVVSLINSFSFNVTENAEYVANFELPSFTVSVEADPQEGGVVTGNGTYTYGETATVSVIPNANYQFAGWIENGSVVSVDDVYSFVVTEDHHLVAHLEFVTGIDEHNAANVSLFPNPVRDKLTILSKEPVLQYRIYDMKGALVSQMAGLSEKNPEIDVDALPVGTYVICLTFGDTVQTMKFVKE